MSIQIITDSASDIEQKEFNNVTVIPMCVTIEDRTYRDGIDLSKSNFYRFLEDSEIMPVTSLVPPYRFMETYDKITVAGDEAIVITISSGLSGTYQSACTAAYEYDNISVIDSGLVTAAQRILIIRCQQLIDQGLTRSEIVRQLEDEKKKIVVFASVDTLKYLQKGGRVSKSTAVVGGLIGIKPILTLSDGKLIPIGKARGSKQSHLFLNRKVAEVGGIAFSLPYAVAYSGNDDSNLRKYLANNLELLTDAPHEIDIVQIGSAVGTHAGPGAVLVAFFSR